jgi:aldose 1-epimerase
MTWWWKNSRVAVLGIALLAAGCGKQQPRTDFCGFKPGPSKTVYFSSTADGKKMSVTKTSYGKLPDGTDIYLYTLANANGMKVKLITYGATITDVEVPDRNGKIANVTLCHDSLTGYLQEPSPYFGATVGRYANRIAKGKFTLDGKEYTLAVNNGKNHLHGGLKAFDKVVWQAEPLLEPAAIGVIFRYRSPDGEEGYPGKLSVKATYSLTDKNELKMDCEANCDKPTVVNLTNHAYWNLAGAGQGDVLHHEVMLPASRYLAVDEGLIPMGDPRPVKDTPMDFTRPMTIGARIDKVEGGYDHCYVLDKPNGGNSFSLAARVSEPSSGRVLEIFTTQPAIQFYTGNFLDGKITAGGKTYNKHFGFCLETQHYPDSPNHPSYPSTVLRPGETYRQTTVWKFGVQK